MSERELINGVRQSFLAFAIKAFNIVNPGQDCIPTACDQPQARRG
jgi:hypothetical protein